MYCRNRHQPITGLTEIPCLGNRQAKFRRIPALFLDDAPSLFQYHTTVEAAKFSMEMSRQNLEISVNPGVKPCRAISKRHNRTCSPMESKEQIRRSSAIQVDEWVRDAMNLVATTTCRALRNKTGMLNIPWTIRIACGKWNCCKNLFNSERRDDETAFAQCKRIY